MNKTRDPAYCSGCWLPTMVENIAKWDPKSRKDPHCDTCLKAFLKDEGWEAKKDSNICFGCGAIVPYETVRFWNRETEGFDPVCDTCKEKVTSDPMWINLMRETKGTDGLGKEG